MKIRPNSGPFSTFLGCSGRASESRRPQKTREIPCFEDVPMTPTGSEQPAKLREKTGLGDLVYPRVYPSQAIDDDGAKELLAIWARLDEAARRDLLAVARGLEHLAS